MLVLLFKLLVLSFAFHYYKNRYPEEYQGYSKQLFEYMENNEHFKHVLPYLVKVGYTFIYIYSYFQILLDKVIRITSPYVKLLRDKTCDVLIKYKIISGKSEENILINDKTIITFYNEGKLVKQDEFFSIFSLLLHADIKNCEPVNAFDLVTIADLKNILTFIPDECKYDLLDIRFLALYLKHNDKSHIIDLCNNTQNYYVVGNVVNSVFLKYYLVNVLNIALDTSKSFVYTLELMDHNVQMVYLDETQSIVFQKDGYIVTNSNVPDTTEICNNVVNDILEEIEKIVINEIEESVVEDESETIFKDVVQEESVLQEESVSNEIEEPVSNEIEEPIINEIEEPNNK